MLEIEHIISFFHISLSVVEENFCVYEDEKLR